jgi:hypothetical protein
MHLEWPRLSKAVYRGAYLGTAASIFAEGDSPEKFSAFASRIA